MIELRAVSAAENLIRLSSVELFLCRKQYSSSLVSSKAAFSSSSYLSPANILEVHWNMFDGESGIREYLWAIGTVEGGQQLLAYTSTGLANRAEYSGPEPAHGSDIYVTILGTNVAGLTAKLQLPPIKVDYTPPSVSVRLLNRLLHGNTGQQYVTRNTVDVSWNETRDSESGIDYCEWGIGKNVQYRSFRSL